MRRGARLSSTVSTPVLFKFGGKIQKGRVLTTIEEEYGLAHTPCGGAFSYFRGFCLFGFFHLSIL